MWKRLLGSVSDKMPDFNHDLLLEFRKQKIADIPVYLDTMYKQSMVMLEAGLAKTDIGGGAKDRPMLKYLGYRDVTPEERVAYLRRSQSYEKVFDINMTNYKMMVYEFEFENQLFQRFIAVPYIDNYKIKVDGIDYYPLFAIVEKGGLHKGEDDLTLRVMRFNMRYWRKDVVTFKTLRGSTWKEYNLQVKLHKKTSAKKRRPPIILYHLAKYGFEQTMEMYGAKDIVTIVDKTSDDETLDWVRIGDGFYIQAPMKSFRDQHIRRIICSLVVIYKFWKRIDCVETLMGHEYYQVALGKYAYSTITSVQLLYNNASDHLNMNETMLDPVAIYQQKSIGIEANNMDELLLYMFNNMDALLADRSANNLYTKKIGCQDQMLSGVVQKFNNDLFKYIINSRGGISKESVKQVMHSNTYMKWLSQSRMFRGMPDIYNDNYLLSIGAKRFRSVDNMEVASDAQTQNSLPISLLKAHPSQLVVESILSIPSSSPIVTGTINPFLEVDSDGNIIKPEWAEEIADVFAQ